MTGASKTIFSPEYTGHLPGGAEGKDLAHMVRPDISYAVNHLARNMSVPTEADDVELNRVLAYVADTPRAGVVRVVSGRPPQGAVCPLLWSGPAVGPAPPGAGVCQPRNRRSMICCPRSDSIRSG